MSAPASGNDAIQPVPSIPRERVTLSPDEAIARLAARREVLRTQLRSLEEDDGESGRPRFSNHLAEDAQDQQQRQGAAVVRQMLLHDLKQVEHALDRSSLGQYGVCEDCGHDIPVRRLEIIPAATLCVNCQSRREARHTAH